MDESQDAPPEPTPRGSRAFRAELATELPRWVEDGLVAPEAANLLRQRYALGEKNADLASAAIFLLGALLVGGGILSFVAWNWAGLPVVVKLVALGAALVGSHISGWWLWKVRGTWPRAGHALTVLGTLVFGASIGLVAQIFNVSGTWYHFPGAWALGAAVAAWSLRSAPNGVLAVGLAAVWACGWTDDKGGAAAATPLLLAAVFLPLAWLERSRLLFAATVVAVGTTSAVVAGMTGHESPAVFAALLGAAAALLAWPIAFSDGTTGASFAGVARVLGVLLFAHLAYIASFRESAHHLSFDRIDGESFVWAIGAAAWFTAATAFVVAGALRAGDFAAAARGRVPTLAMVAATFLLLVSMTLRPGSDLVVVAGNAAVAVPAILAVASSMRDLARGRFWLGTLALAALIVTRFFEYETNLGVKAAVFIGSGIAVILVGVAFERRRKAEERKHAA